ncbi:MAG: DUF2344 domain-containing protein [Spirochaetes bacterium]|nr:DUF2344 domain-containing protein [Spirochaetota bacterium]
MTSESRSFFDKVYPFLKKVQKPARYLGGELNSIKKVTYSFRVALCFPDIYEIGMSNNAMRILYSGLNDLDNIVCDRVFTPASDFANLIKENNFPLYGLDTLQPVVSSDILAFTVGFELAATNIIHTLNLSGIPLDKSKRENFHPIVIAGGPGISNPLPFSNIFDAIWIGEAEPDFFSLCTALNELKNNGATRVEILDKIKSHPAIWIPGKKATRNIFKGFSAFASILKYPKPVLKPVQHHGVVEIMRGCPNGCRFCHAGYFYRPCRLKDPEIILKEVAAVVDQGFTSITLSSLSSGDYPGIFDLVQYLNRLYSGRGISFQLPSLKVESFSLNILAELSDVRKGALTFAVETPRPEWQKAINKNVSIEKIISILKTAGSYGYKTAKFYFMLGLPLGAGSECEELEIVKFIESIARDSDLNLNITLSTFVPKPHTPYQDSSQISWTEAQRRIYAIKDALRYNKRIKISYNSPLMSAVEGFIARGDERVGNALVESYEAGCIFDAWDDQFKKDVWIEILDKHSLLNFHEARESRPWSDIDIKVSPTYLKRELNRSVLAEVTKACSEPCIDYCGSCSTQHHVESTTDFNSSVSKLMQALAKDLGSTSYRDVTTHKLNPSNTVVNPVRTRIILGFSKFDNASFYAHHDLHSVIAYAIIKAGFNLEYSLGFNPMPRLELSEPLPLGFYSDDEYAAYIVNSAFTDLNPNLDDYIYKLQAWLPDTVKVNSILAMPLRDGLKIHSLSSLYWGSDYELDFNDTNFAVQNICDSMLSDISESENSVLKELFSCSVNNSKLMFTLPATGIKAWGLSSIITKAIGEPLMQTGIRGKRLVQYAQLPDNTCSVRISYLEFFQKIQKAYMTEV